MSIQRAENLLTELQNIYNSDSSNEEKDQAFRKVLYPEGTKSLDQAVKGDVVIVQGVRGYGNHSARVQITKINRKTLVGVEIPGSYGAGREWKIHKECRDCFVDLASTRRLAGQSAGE